MTLYCYYFRPDGTVERESVGCRKNKDCYAFKVGPYDINTHLGFNEIGKIISLDSYNDDHYGCRMYSTEKLEITQKMKDFSENRAKKIQEIWDMRKQMEGELHKMKTDFEDGFSY